MGVSNTPLRPLAQDRCTIQVWPPALP